MRVDVEGREWKRVAAVVVVLQRLFDHFVGQGVANSASRRVELPNACAESPFLGGISHLSQKAKQATLSRSLYFRRVEAEAVARHGDFDCRRFIGCILRQESECSMKAVGERCNGALGHAVICELEVGEGKRSSTR